MRVTLSEGIGEGHSGLYTEPHHYNYCQGSINTSQHVEFCLNEGL